MDSILKWYRQEGIIFKGGSGAGTNLSHIRSSAEGMRGGGTASGPVSFMRGADASAGTIKSGGKTRRAAKMVILDADHPDIEEFVWCKAVEERKARVLRDHGFDMDLDGRDSFSVQYQNANNSVRVTDEFMQAVVADADWTLNAVTTGEALRTVRARDLWRQIAEAAWECADPGLQFDTTINRWHTASSTGRIEASNPCFTGDTLVHTDKGLIRFDELFDRANHGEEFGVYTHDITNADDAGRSRGAHHARGVHDHRSQPDRPAALQQRDGAALHPGPPDLHAQPGVRRGGGADRRRSGALARRPDAGGERRLGAPGQQRPRRLLDQGGQGQGRRAALPREVVVRARPLPRLADR